MIRIYPPANNSVKTEIHLSGSKSLSNRLLMIKAISGLDFFIDNLSDSEDTKLLNGCLSQIKNKSHHLLNVNNAGTDMRFLTAYLSITPGEWLLTGSNRMKQRPIGELVNGLKKLGANISFEENVNYPPIKIKGKKLNGNAIDIDGSISSQFISALLLIAPSLKNGLVLNLKTEPVSLPYVKMTIELLKKFNISVRFKGNKIEIPESAFKTNQQSFYIESDWSAASYWYSIVALSENADITLSCFKKNSTQADSVLPEIFNQLGVKSDFSERTVRLTKQTKSIDEFNYDFYNCPDIATTVAVVCFGLGIKTHLTGLKTLKIKESDRINALKTELEKLGAKTETTNDSIKIIPAYESVLIDEKISTYNDHRMAMSFAPLCFVIPGITIENPYVVEKSYPAFWKDLENCGFKFKS